MSVKSFLNDVMLDESFEYDDLKTISFIVREEKRYDEMNRKYVFQGYLFNQTATIKFDYDSDRLGRIVDKIVKLKNPPKYLINFSVKDEKNCKK